MSTKPFDPSITELCRVAESRVHIAIVINERAPRDFETEVRNEQQTIWRDRASTKSDIRDSILSIMLDFLAGDRMYNQCSGTSIRELALSQLGRDMISDSQGEGAWERHYQQRYSRLVKDGREDSEEAEKLTIMIETLKLYRGLGVFVNDEYNPAKARSTDRRDKRQRFFGVEVA